MARQNKFFKAIQDSFSQLFANNISESSNSSVNDSISWSANDETITVKKVDYEALQNDNFNKTEIIKQLKRKDEENQTLIDDYENTFNTIATKDLKSGKFRNPKNNSYSARKLLDEIEKLKSSEDRLRSHVQALKRDSLLDEQKHVQAMSLKDKEMEFLKIKIEDIGREIQELKNRVDELLFTNKEVSLALEKKCKELAEALELCKILSE